MTRDYQKEYDREKYIAKRYNVKFMVNTDADIIDALDKQANKQGFIKKSIRHYIAAGCPETEKTENADDSD